MKQILKTSIYILSITLLISCGTDKKIAVNSELNTDYIKSRELISGKLNTSEYKEMIKNFEKALKTKMPQNKPILINFKQKAPNCIAVRFSQSDNRDIAKKTIQISSRITTKSNAVDFFVYTKDAFQAEIYEKLPEFKRDSGFFYDKIFTKHENCAAFLLLKPNGDYVIYYGEDYYSEVEKFLDKN